MKRIGLLLCLFSVVLMLALGLFFYLSLKPSFLDRSMRNSVLGMDMEMRSLIDQGLKYDALEKSQTGLYIYSHDTLVYWNRNDVNSKLLHDKVVVGHDTICSLLSGDYYVKSYMVGNKAYYVYKLVRTTYQIDNPYFANENKTLPRFVEADFQLVENDNGISVTNADGKVLAIYKIVDKPRLKAKFRYLWPLPFIVLVIVGLLLAYVKPTESQLRMVKSSHFIGIGIFVILLISVIGTYLFYKIRIRNENERMQHQALNLMVKRDVNFEISYSRFIQQLQADTALNKMLFSDSVVLADVILGYTKDLFFDEYMLPYSTTLTICAPGGEIIIQPEGFVTECDSYFREKLANNKHEKVDENLYLMDYFTLDPNYLGKTDLVSKDSLTKKTLYFEFYKPIAPEGFGFPQLLKEANSLKQYDYSVASYKGNILVYKYGRYVYPNFLNSLKVKDLEFSYSSKYKHFARIDKENNAVVVSTPTKGFSQKTAPFSLFFLGLSLPFLLIVWLTHPRKLRKWRDRSFHWRLQAVVLLTLGISFIAIGPVSVLYMRTLYNQNITDAQFETTRTLSLEMRNNLDCATLMQTASKHTWTDILQHYANTFFTDLNLYRLNGQLLATTRPEIYEYNLQAPVMNAEAYHSLNSNKDLFFTHEEHLGKGKYESAYIPLTDANGNTLAYLNTPYFASTTDLHNEIRNYILTYLNIIIILFGGALFFILLITRHLTRPLALIQNKLGDLKIDQKNEPIEWNNNDEIGALIKQYNQLIVELEKSAAELKRTTAESAWRGVARQVAHEIKNSLTPMRLSVQLLQRNIDNGKATPEQIQRTTNTLIEQIDALSDIASSFSRYAKLPENHPAPLDLAELVQNVVNLYDNVENIEFYYDFDKAKDHTYNGDKTNLNSVVGNLIKNATQAIGSKPGGRIDVGLKNTETAFIISVKDNGKGIKDEDKDRIFLPNFTTKTGGSGVGLSLSYNIVHAAGGTITFESQEGEGTEFVIVLPKKLPNKV